MKQTEFLDVSLDLQSSTYEPYRKPNSELLYINSKSNNLEYIKKELPKMIGKRISTLSSNEEAFENAIPQYQKVLKDNFYKESLKFDGTSIQKPKRKRKRSIMFYHPPFCASVKTNIGKEFLKLVSKHFGKDNRYHAILNRNNVKVSYSCMGNMKSIITAHNRKILSEKSTNQKKNCNCQKGRTCPLDGECHATKVIYKATVTSANDVKEYVGSTGRTFKSRYNLHKSSFKQSKKTTELANYIGKLDESNINYNIQWKIMHQLKEIPPLEKNGCTLCNLERFELARTDKNKSLNKRKEIQARCPHNKGSYF